MNKTILRLALKLKLVKWRTLSLYSDDIRKRYPQYEIGKGTYGSPKVLVCGEGTTPAISGYCSIASGVTIFRGGEHRTDRVTTYPFSVLSRKAIEIKGHPRSKGDVVIGNDVWLGTESMILSGVKISDGVVVAARAVAARDVAPYAIVAGTFAHEIGRRFDESTIDRLPAIPW